ncbi:uncharacterized protein LOC122508823 [Leptopilina heterotoma]|uniref:uncharacterized protein LOC122508823 n=1 Tax=Leptopilina heterotoma TaxID=63436 RepID=UPI001CA9D7E3|nr:uncharacterized protein LOC122508823 [Leptopilina heterotoma]
MIKNSWNDISLSLISHELSKENYFREVLFKLWTLIDMNFKSQIQNILNNIRNLSWMDKITQKATNSKEVDEKYYKTNNDQRIIKIICHKNEGHYFKIMAKEASNNFWKKKMLLDFCQFQNTIISSEEDCWRLQTSIMHPLTWI